MFFKILDLAVKVMKKKLDLKDGLLRVCFVVLGNVIYALAVKFFLISGGLATGGSIGSALAVNHLTGFSVLRFVLIFNGLMLPAGFLALGDRSALTAM